MGDFWKAVAAVCGLVVAILGFMQFQAMQGSTGEPSVPTARTRVTSDACIEGFVWRDAFADDHVCVTSGEREQVRADNAAAASRIDPNGQAGLDSCIDGHGWVWREAREGDHVCVSNEQRAQVRADNQAAASRVAP